MPALEAQRGRQALSTDDQPSRALQKTRGFQLPTLLWGLGRTPGRTRSREGGVKHPELQGTSDSNTKLAF